MSFSEIPVSATLLIAIAGAAALVYFPFLAVAVARVTVGWVFVESGWGKLHHLDKVQAFFESLGIPAASLQAPLVASLEFGGGLLLLAGLATRLASLPLMVIMAVMAIGAIAMGLIGRPRHSWPGGGH